MNVNNKHHGSSYQCFGTDEQSSKEIKNEFGSPEDQVTNSGIVLLKTKIEDFPVDLLAKITYLVDDARITKLVCKAFQKGTNHPNRMLRTLDDIIAYKGSEVEEIIAKMGQGKGPEEKLKEVFKELVSEAKNLKDEEITRWIESNYSLDFKHYVELDKLIADVNLIRFAKGAETRNIKLPKLRDEDISNQAIQLREWLKDNSANLGIIDCNSKGLTRIPPELGQLTSLEDLILRHNEIRSIPEEIGKLTSLKQLDLCLNQISSIPPEIGKLTSLKDLMLRNNEIRSIPEEIGKLTSLTLLDLCDNQISSIPPEIGKLTSLKFLVLSYNQINSIPPELGKLTSLIRLNLCNNQISSIPAEIGKLTSLNRLCLQNNQISSIPPELGQLTNLEELYLYNNQISFIPEEVRQLEAFMDLD